MSKRGKNQGPKASHPADPPGPARALAPTLTATPARRTAAPGAAAARSFWRWFVRELPWLLALGVVTFLVWGYDTDRLSLKNWAVPSEYKGDALETLASIRAAADGDYRPFHSEVIKRLGAPYEANWNDYPRYEKIPTYLLGVLARWFGLMQASNAGILLAYLTSATAFYLCCRWLKHRREWSFAGALLFGFAYFHALSKLGQVMLTFTWTIPPAILSVWLVLFSRRMRLGDPRSWFCFVIAIIMGLSNPYNLGMYAQLLVIALALGWFINRRRDNLRIGVLALVLAAVACLAISFPAFAYQWAHGENSSPLTPRYADSEQYGLKPMELIMPPATHHLAYFSYLGHWYRAASWVHGEVFTPYLGVVGICGLIWLGIEAAACLLRVSRRKVPTHALQSLWVLFFATVGGLNGLLVLAGIQVWWVGSRFSSFITALVLLFLVSRLSLLSRRWPRWARRAVAAVVLVIGLWDQTPQKVTRAETDQLRADVENDRGFVEKMEGHLPAGAMVFQLPVMKFPGGKPVFHLDEYQELRPYLYAKTLRFSFGSDQGRPRDAWQGELERMSAQQMVENPRRYGFSAIWVERNGYEDDAKLLIAGLLNQLPGTDTERLITDDRDEQICILLPPSPQRELPPVNGMLITFRHGWQPELIRLGKPVRWTTGNASLAFFNPGSSAVNCKLTCEIGALDERTASLEFAGQRIWTNRLQPKVAVPLELNLLAKPGNNVIRIETSGRAFHPPDNPDQSFAIGLDDLKIIPQPAGGTNRPEPPRP